jgi:hypothetical protein
MDRHQAQDAHSCSAAMRVKRLEAMSEFYCQDAALRIRVSGSVG